MTQTALERVRAAVLRAFDEGLLGVMAAHHKIAEGQLRAFACGDNNALTVDEAVRIARSLLKDSP